MPQIQRIEALEARMQTGGEKAASLGRRLEVVKRKIDAWERREGEWQARTSRRLWILWTIMGVFATVLAAALAVEGVRRPAVVADMPEDNTNLQCTADWCHRERTDLASDPSISRNSEGQAKWLITPMGLVVEDNGLEGFCITTPMIATKSLPSAMLTDCRKTPATDS
jgi:hypothetical protein